MAQHHLWIWLLCLQTWSEAIEREPDCSMVLNGILGESVTLPVDIKDGQKINNIAWTSKSSVAFVTPKVGGHELTVTQDIYKGRLEVTNQTYNLIIRNLRMKDAGTYKADINEKNREKTITKIYCLQIYSRLAKPKITKSSITSLNNTCNITLTCSVEEEEKNVVYSWSPSGEESNVLQIFHSPMDQKLTYTCTASNPVSNNSDSVTVQQPCTDSPSFHPYHGVLPGGLAALSLLMLIPVVALLFHLYKRRRDDVSKKIIYSAVSRNAHLTESRIYDEIPQSTMLSRTEEPVTTIYSSVQLYEKTGKTNMKDERPPKTLCNEIVV
ncbi:SLAM family member 5 isoform 4 precursor [Rattus norvegicus]|uniref:SLAM family member 5 isoform 4 precursor n=1 Tax=Rattus norvegicus TaxID=10116 RepID=UPI0004E49196|nr:SLAM family member 5 isoform 4 precursor [Rattus norvegicus]|eukprot:XP_008767978.1 PREDICTED: SLAM family member 5 isoform X3 [Rattus norvegicus]